MTVKFSLNFEIFHVCRRQRRRASIKNRYMSQAEQKRQISKHKLERLARMSHLLAWVYDKSKASAFQKERR